MLFRTLVFRAAHLPRTKARALAPWWRVTGGLACVVAMGTGGAACGTAERAAFSDIGRDPAAGDGGDHPNARAGAEGRDGTRLKLTGHDGEDGSRFIESYTIFDTKLSIQCTFRLAADGKLRCLPYIFSVADRFADAACSTPIVREVKKDCPTSPPKYAYKDKEKSCTDAREYVVPVTGPYSGPTYEKTVAFGCSLEKRDDVLFSYYSVGADVSPTDFVMGTKFPN